MQRFLLLLCLIASPLLLLAQKSEVGISLNGYNYYGDINPYSTPYFPETEYGASLFYRYNMHNNWAVRVQGAFGQVSDDDRRYFERQGNDPIVDFKTTFYSGSAMLEFNILGRMNGSKKRMVSPYLTAGVGALFFDPTTNTESFYKTELTPKEVNQDFSKTSFITPFGAGFKFYLSDKWTLGLEALMIPTYADYLDGASDSRDPNNNDWLSTASLGISYRFGKSDKDGDGITDKEDECPDVPGPVALKGCPDSDGDGIADKNDDCPTVAGLAKFKGCPDTDGDGIVDSKDECPTEAGLAKFNGCPDTDGDGIVNSKDECPTVAGLAKFNGCPDTDGDGIVDSKDKCPTEAGLAKFDGCPDTDGDGIVDSEDECPTEKGPVALKGCPDKDGDGVADKIDKCPTVPGPISNQGCPEIEKKDLEKIAFVIQNVQFRTNKTELQPASIPVLNEIVGLMKKYPAYSLKIEGHTDSDGSDESNLALSKGRALTCFDFLISKGIAADRMSHDGFGESKPIASNDTKEGKAENRRVNFEMYIR